MYLEVLGRGDEVLARHAIERFPVRIGRAYDNDIIFDDAYVAPHHALLELQSESGEIASGGAAAGEGVVASRRVIARDLGSKNALLLRGSTRRVQTVVLDAGTEIGLGHTFVRLRPLDYPVAPERKDQLALRSRRGLVFTALLAVAFGMTAWEHYLRYVDEFKPAELVSAIAGLLLALTVWVGAWGFATRLLLGRPHVIMHAIIATGALVALEFAHVGLSHLAYAASLPLLPRALPFLGAAIAAAMLYAHLKLMRPRWHRLPAVLATTVAAIGLLAMQLPQWMARKEQPEQYLTDLKAPWLRFAVPESTDQFFQRAAALKQRVDQARAKKGE
jgi:pSer/pThr/pTyr-binding forkhead associated (FHA) protein